MSRPWIKSEKMEPPVTRDRARFWLELYIPERVQASPIADKKKGLAMGVYLGSGSFRLAGQKTATTERVAAWRHLGGNQNPVTTDHGLQHMAEVEAPDG